MIIDRVMSFLVSRRHLFFFYSYPQGYPTQTIEAMLQPVGDQATDQLREFLQQRQEAGVRLQAHVHPSFIQGPTIYIPRIYEAPAVPHMISPASICKAWFQSVLDAAQDRVTVNNHNHHLLPTSQLCYYTTEWLHRPTEDRFRIHTFLITEFRLCRVVNPLH